MTPCWLPPLEQQRRPVDSQALNQELFERRRAATFSMPRVMGSLEDQFVDARREVEHASFAARQVGEVYPDPIRHRTLAQALGPPQWSQLTTESHYHHTSSLRDTSVTRILFAVMAHHQG
jgi:hypothetical protein